MLPNNPDKSLPKNVLVISDGRIHPPLIGRFWLRNMLMEKQGFGFSWVHSMEKLPNMDLDGFHGMVLYFHHKEISEAALDAFDSFINDGGGALALHSATASYKDQKRFTDILGGKFTGHGPVTAFNMMPASTTSPIFGCISEFQVVDELYLHDLQPDIDVHFNALYKGQKIPTVWTRLHGDGRVCYACPGHRAASMRVPSYQRLLSRALTWITQ
ncbi:MAG: ThuA domain-containing protein [Anaerolineales bacterium]|jgi:type 1 glutamine amidotransferase